MVVLYSKSLRFFRVFFAQAFLAISLFMLIASAFAETNASLTFDSPSDGTYVSSRFPEFRLKLEGVADLADLSLVVGGDPSPKNACTLEKTGIFAHCSLSVSLDNGWQSISALLYDGGSLIAQANVSIAVDLDTDGVPDHLDKCGGTAETDEVNLDGCSAIQLDSDGDGISNVEEFLQVLPAINQLLLSPSDAPTEVSQPLQEAVEDGLVFETPAHNSLVPNSKPIIRLRGDRAKNYSGSILELSIDGKSIASCNFDVATAIGRCLLSQPLQYGWQTLEASLSSSEGELGKAIISVALDSDEDGTSDHQDQCSNTSLKEVANKWGCAPSQIDSDLDGISDIDELAGGSNPYSRNSYPAVSVHSFSALPSHISRAGDSTGLSWSVGGATSISLKNDANGTTIRGLSAVGTARVSPLIATTYTLEATGPAGTKSDQVRVSITNSAPQNQWPTSPLDQVTEAVGSSLTVSDDGSVFLGAFDGNYYRFTPGGDLAWTMENIGIVMNKAAVSGSTVFVGTNSTSGGSVRALNAEKEVLWIERTSSGVIASPVLNPSKTILYIATYDGTVLGLDVSSGNRVWSYKLPEGETVSATPALSSDNSTLYIHSNSHQVFAVIVKINEVQTSLDSQQIILESDVEASDSKSSLRWQSDISN
ncbi:PQQ-binding-like beta-propeller repeat protein [Microbulbifer sp. ZKSA004]|uniref:outer membrane protein assembly factor BamB family protein n=1 Tax=Microbulbifer sp. ZKSA004 TaxID=3243389 RepID=UPI0040391532